MADPCCITISVPTYSVVGSSQTALGDIELTTETKYLAVVDGTESQTVQVTIPTYDLAFGPPQTFDFTGTIDVNTVTGVTATTGTFLTDVGVTNKTINIPVLGTQNLDIAQVYGTTNQTVAISHTEYEIATSPIDIDWSTDINIECVTDITPATQSVLTGIKAPCESKTLNYLSSTGSVLPQDITLDVPTYTLETEAKVIKGAIDSVTIPPCNIPVLLPDGNYTVPSYSPVTSSFSYASLQDAGNATLYDYTLSGNTPITIEGATATIPPCDIQVLRFWYNQQGSIQVPSFDITTSTQTVEADIVIPSCTVYSYSWETDYAYLKDYWIKSTPRALVCKFNDYDLETENKKLDYTAKIKVPIYKTDVENKHFDYNVPNFEKIVIQDCQVPIIEEVNAYAKIAGKIKVNLGKIDETITTPLISCSTIPVPIYSTATHTIDFSCSTNSYSLSETVVPNSITVPSYSQSCSSVSLKSYAKAYYSSSSIPSRTLVPCSPGGYQKQPPTPTWTNTGRAKLRLDVAYRKGVAKKLEKEGKNVPDGWHMDDPGCQLCIFVRDYDTGAILEELDNSIDLWGWVTAKDAENSFNDKFDPFGNKVRGDSRYEQNPIDLIKANLRIERHHQLENVKFIDTPLKSGHLSYEQLKPHMPYHKIKY
jgi:hypothetical protein